MRRFFKNWWFRFQAYYHGHFGVIMLKPGYEEEVDSIFRVSSNSDEFVLDFVRELASTGPGWSVVWSNVEGVDRANGN